MAAVQGRDDYDLELRIRRADGQYRWFKARATPVRDEGRTVRWFGTCTDITDIVEARETLRRSREELERLVGERTRSLAAANDRLTAEIAERQRTEEALLQAQKLEAVGQLTSGVAHDFNNLLTGVLGNLELLERRLKSQESLRRLRAARLAAERGARLTHQLLAFSRKQRLAPTPLDLNRLVSEASDMLFRTIGATVRIETVLTEGLWPALVDPTQTELVLLNLAINARDAMPEGGRLTIRTANVSRGDAPPDLAPGDYVLISVSDTGEGMSEEVLRRAVEPFFTTKEPGKGSGLGLSMVHGVATQSGGGLHIDSRLGRGTTVNVYLPRARRLSAAAREREPLSAAVHEAGNHHGRRRRSGCAGSGGQQPRKPRLPYAGRRERTGRARFAGAKRAGRLADRGHGDAGDERGRADQAGTRAPGRSQSNAGHRLRRYCSLRASRG